MMWILGFLLARVHVEISSAKLVHTWGPFIRVMCGVRVQRQVHQLWQVVKP